MCQINFARVLDNINRYGHMVIHVYKGYKRYVETEQGEIKALNRAWGGPGPIDIKVSRRKVPPGTS